MENVIFGLHKGCDNLSLPWISKDLIFLHSLGGSDKTNSWSDISLLPDIVGYEEIGKSKPHLFSNKFW